MPAVGAFDADVYNHEEVFEDDYHDEDYDHDHENAGEEDEDYDYFDDDFLRTYAIDIDAQTDCRDSPDELMDCEELKADGVCTDPSRDLLGQRELCPVTCDLCPDPPSQTAIWSDQDCYDYMDDVHVYFTNTNPKGDDFVAIYKAYHDLGNSTSVQEHQEAAEEHEMWLYCCGNIDEHCKTSSGGVIFGERGVHPRIRWTTFPMQPGRYKAALLRYDGTLLAESEHFSAKSEGDSCATECTNAVYADELCLETIGGKLDLLHIHFETCTPEVNNRIAIYASGLDGRHVAEIEPQLWLKTCGDYDCREEHSAHVISFGKDGQALKGALGAWSLPPGAYRAHLMKATENVPFGRSVAMSEEIVVKGEGEVCPWEEEL